jgi:beta-glucosidase-like glycosyl hydrolase/CubicO group peptidase (beta-lactamase class C family)
MKQLFSIKALLIAPIFIGAYLLAHNAQLEAERPANTTHENEIAEVVIPNPWVEKTLKEMSLREKIGQFFMVAAYSNKGDKHLATIDSLVLHDRIGGIIFFQGERENLTTAIDRFQGEASVPLLVGMDAEWGVQMRLFGEERFPYNYTIGAANDPKLTKKIAKMMGQECRELGIHINFAPVADVNSNPKNPVIGFRSYGENPKDVASHVAAAVEGMEEQGVMTSIKHFPGHGDTEVDSHYDLPVVNNTYSQINAIDFFPFRSGIRAGASTVMIGHLNVPALDSTGTPSSLSKRTIQNYLRGELGFKGLVVSDALGMKAVADRYGKTEVVVKAFEAGCDILLFPKSVKEAIDAIEAKVNLGEIDEDEIVERCRKVLLAKHKHIVKRPKYKEFTKEEITLAKKMLYEKAITVIKNEEELLPIKRFDKKIAHVSIGAHTDVLNASMDLVSKVDHFHFYNGDEAVRRFKHRLNEYDLIITSVHSKSVVSRGDYGMPAGWRGWVKSLPADKENVLTVFGNPYALSKNIDLSHIEAVVIGYENHELALDRAGQFLMGTFESTGKLPVTINSKFKRGRSIKVKWGGKLKESQPEEVGVSRKKLSLIDDVVQKGIADGAFPGCQVLVAVEGKIIYNKSFGHHTYSKKQAVLDDDLYDIASITKVAASTFSLMYLDSKEEFSLEGRLLDYIPEVVQNTPYASMRVRHMLAHQAGLHPWIPFYVETLKNHRPDPAVYATERSDEFPTQVANNMWIRKGYKEVMYQEILRKPLKAKKYKYSDLGYYFMKAIIEKKTGKSLDQFVEDQFYRPMGLSNIMYNPLRKVGLDRIPPTENDTIFRKQLVHGFVHDQGASMMGGVGGHAGLFSNARDLAGIMQLFLNQGSYGGVEYIRPDVIKEYTGCQYCPKNRRGAGFDKPMPSRKGGPTSKLAPLSSFGHSGFTGTLVWADPEYKVNFVFLSNRVYPNAENWKIIKMNIRTDIQKIIYEALNEVK